MNLPMLSRPRSNSVDLELGHVASRETFATGSSTSSTQTLVDSNDSSAASDKKRALKKLGLAMGIGLTTIAGVITGVSVSGYKSGTKSFNTELNSFCQQFGNVSWVVPNSPATNFSSFYANFHNQPANLTQPCLNLFMTGKTVANPQPNQIQYSFGPFPLNSSSQATYPVIVTNGTDVTIKNQTLPRPVFFW